MIVSKNKRVKLQSEPTFPFLDIQFEWGPDQKLRTTVHLKENQQLKYLNADGCHTLSCIKAVPYRVINRLSKLKSLTKQNIDQTLDALYPLHAQALRSAKIAPKYFPTLA